MAKTINMLSEADIAKGQGVLSAYEELVSLVKKNLSDSFELKINEVKFADIMHYHTVSFKYYLTLPFTKIKSTTVGYVHFLPETLENSIKLPKFMTKVFYKYVIDFYKGMDFLVTVNPYFIDKLVGYGIPKEKIAYIPNYVSGDRFFKIDDSVKPSIREEFGIKKDKFVVLCVGQLQKRKGVKDFIEVAKKMPDIQFIWAGGFSFKQISDGYNELKKLVEDPPKNVKFLGIIPREKMNELYNISDIMFLPSYEELFPMTVLESANCNIPILLRDIELYKGILSGYYLKGNNNIEFEKEIRKLKDNNDYYVEASELSKKCSDYYSEENVSKMWRSYYNRIYSMTSKKNWRKESKYGDIK